MTCLVYAQELLEYKINGLQGELLDNAQAYLGELPESEAERSNFVYSTRSKLTQSLSALGYYDAGVFITINRESAVWLMTVDVEPGDPVRISSIDVQIRGEARQDQAFDKILANNPLIIGEPLNHEEYENFKLSIQSAGQKHGYLSGSLILHRVAVDVAGRTATIELHYTSGPRYHFGEITRDEFPLADRHFDNMQPFEEGDPFDIEKIRSFQGQLQRAGYFGSALVYPQQADHETRTVPIHVELTPAVRHRFRVGLGYSTDTEQRISLSWATPQVNSYGHHQETRYEYSPIRPRGRVNYVIPLSHPTDDVMFLRARIESNEFGDLESDQQGASVGREWRWGEWLTTSHLRYLSEDWDVGNTSKTNDYVLPGLSFSHRYSEGDVLDPPSGFSQLYGIEFGAGAAGSDIDLLRAHVQWRLVMTPAERQRLVSRLELGAVWFSSTDRPDLAPSLSFFAGGSQSIRGYDYQSLGAEAEVPVGGGDTVSLVVGGDRLLVGSVEYQYYIRPEWRAAVFVDAGNAFNEGEFEAAVGAGVGVHYISPVGAVRLDFGNSVSEDSRKWRVHLTIGAEF